MSSTYGDSLKLSIFGQSHGPAIGMTLDGIPAGLPVDFDALCAFMSRRAPGQDAFSTPRKEADLPQILSGVLNGITCGAPIAATISNTNTRSSDYESLKDLPRPGHADYTAQVKYGGYQDVAGGGHFSGRLTAPLCIAGGLCKQWLEQMGVSVTAHIRSIASIYDDPFDPLDPQIDQVSDDFPVLNAEIGHQMKNAISQARADGDSVGGTIECAVTGLPAGLGEPMFGGMESKIAHIVYGIPAIKAVEFGAGFDVANMRGSECNDAYCMDNGIVRTVTNNCGGILGGITNGMPMLFKVALKPTPSIAVQQQTVSIHAKEERTLQVKGRHDPCIVARAVPVVEAAAAIAVFDAYLSQTNRR